MPWSFGCTKRRPEMMELRPFLGAFVSTKFLRTFGLRNRLRNHQKRTLHAPELRMHQTSSRKDEIEAVLWHFCFNTIFGLRNRPRNHRKWTLRALELRMLQMSSRKDEIEAVLWQSLLKSLLRERFWAHHRPGSLSGLRSPHFVCTAFPPHNFFHGSSSCIR